MLKRTLFLLVGMLFPLLGFGQGETSNWYFGDGAGIHFNNDGSVTALTDGRLNTFEGCAAISDAVGDLLFYTDGIFVFNRDHNIMENGTRLFGDSSSTQSAIIVPKPQDPDIFYIFTVDTSISQNDPDRGLNYSVVDMSMNGGNGAVVQKNINLLQDCTEKIAAVVKDCSEESVWVVTLSSESGEPPIDFFNTYHAFEVNVTGVVTTSVKTTFSNLLIQDARGYLKLSADGTKLVSANALSGLYLYDFDAETGVLSNQERLTINSPHKNSYGLEFSPNQQYLYVQSSNNNPAASPTGHFSALTQYDLLAPDVSASQVILDTRPIYRGALQLGENGKIYRALTQSYLLGTTFLGVINNPNEKGAAADYRHNAISLNGKTGTQGFPPFIQSFFNTTTLIKNNAEAVGNTLTICEGEEFILEADFLAGAVYNWEKDGIPVVNPGNIFQVSSAMLIDSGRYRVEIIPPDPTECKIIGESFISVDPVPEGGVLNLLQCDIDLGNATDGISTFNLEQAIPVSNDRFVFYASIPDRDADNPIPDPVAFTNTQPFAQTIYYRATNSLGCENFGELELQVQDNALGGSPQHSLFSCDEDPEDTTLQATFDLATFAQDTYPSLEVRFYNTPEDVLLEQNALPNTYGSSSQLIYARLEDANQCRGVEQIQLTVNPSPNPDFPDNFIWCTDGPALKISGPEGFDTYRWSQNNGGAELSMQQSVTVSALGNYTLEVGYTYDANGETLHCTNSRVFEILPSNIALIQEILIADISDNNTVQVTVTGDGDYEFSLDGNTYQDSSSFENVPPGFLTVHVRDKNGCGIATELISVIGYPKFFTPNGDGINDSWQIMGTNDQFQASSRITVYDRYGKLLAQFGPGDQGWNGTLDNRVLPASDYWFTVELEDGREFVGHFALKR